MGQKFVDVGPLSLNTDRILYVKWNEPVQGQCTVVMDAGEPVTLSEKEANNLQLRLISLRTEAHSPSTYRELHPRHVIPRPRRSVYGGGG